MGNRINLTEKMKQLLREWKGEILHYFIVNDAENYVTTVRFLVGENIYDIDNKYVLYVDEDGDEVEYSCLSCVKQKEITELKPAVVSGDLSKSLVDEEIRKIFMVKEIETSEFTYDIAIVVQTEKRFFAFWRYLIFDTIQVCESKTKQGCLNKIKELNEQENNGFVETEKRIVEEL